MLCYLDFTNEINFIDAINIFFIPQKKKKDTKKGFQEGDGATNIY